jgi:hypothetical protein
MVKYTKKRYEVEKVLAVKKGLVFIKWKGYASTHNSWEPLEEQRNTLAYARYIAKTRAKIHVKTKKTKAGGAKAPVRASARLVKATRHEKRPLIRGDDVSGLTMLSSAAATLGRLMTVAEGELGKVIHVMVVLGS